MIYGFVLLMGIFLIGCEDRPYQITEPVSKSEYVFDGIVELGTPLSGTTVSAYKFSNLRRGEKIAEAISGTDGTFNLKLKTEYNGPILLTATGGLYRDLITSETVALKPGQKLHSAITHIKMPEKTNINAWTTLAVARVLADRGFWDQGIAKLEDIDRINVDFSHISYFLTGKSSTHVDIRKQEFFNIEKDTLQREDRKAILYLAHGGLAQIAANYTKQLTEKGITISIMDLISALSEDLSNRVFDGRNARGGIVNVGKQANIALNSYTMRKELSEAIRDYCTQLQSKNLLSFEVKNSFEKADHFIHSIATETQPELFPETERPKPIDQAPVIKGANDGIPQKTYRQETTEYTISFIDDEFEPSYKIEPLGEANLIDWKTLPTIHRWSANLDEQSTAPRYLVQVTDDASVKEVRYVFSDRCASFEEADKILQNEEGYYEIIFTQSITGLDFKRDLEGDAHRYCLMIWAIDEVGNSSNHKVEFLWKVLPSPLSVDVNPYRYEPHVRQDDVLNAPTNEVLIGDLIGKGITIGHAIISNPYSSAIAAKLELKKPMSLKLNEEHFEIPAEEIGIEYYKYDLSTNETGAKKIPNADGVISLTQNETVLAKFNLINYFHVGAGWKWNRLRIDFFKRAKNDNRIDGLSLITFSPYLNKPSEYLVPWGTNHMSRYRADFNRPRQ